MGVFDSGETFGSGAIGRNVLSVDYSRVVLAAHSLVEHAFGSEDLNGAQDFRLLVVHGVRVERDGRLHRGERDQLEDVVGHHVAQGARRLIV